MGLSGKTEAPAALEAFRQSLGAQALNVDDFGSWAIVGTHGEVSCAPNGEFHVSIHGFTQRGQDRVAHAFAKFARLLEIGDDGERLFVMGRLPNSDEAKKLRDWLGLRVGV